MEKGAKMMRMILKMSAFVRVGEHLQYGCTGFRFLRDSGFYRICIQDFGIYQICIPDFEIDKNILKSYQTILSMKFCVIFFQVKKLLSEHMSLLSMPPTFRGIMYYNLIITQSFIAHIWL